MLSTLFGSHHLRDSAFCHTARVLVVDWSVNNGWSTEQDSIGICEGERDSFPVSYVREKL